MNTVLKHWFYRPMAKETDVTDMQELARILLIVLNSSNFLQRIKLQKFQSNMRLNLENKNFCWNFCKQKKKAEPHLFFIWMQICSYHVECSCFSKPDLVLRYQRFLPFLQSYWCRLPLFVSWITSLNPGILQWDFLHLTQSATKLLNKWLYLTHALYKHGYNMTYIWV